MTNKNPQNVIESYRKRQQKAQRAPLLIGLAVLFFVAGAAFLIYWLFSSGGPSLSISLFATDTPTPTNTFTPTATATATTTPTITPTVTETPTAAPSATQAGPFIYQVEAGDSLWTIAQKFQVDLLLLITLNNLDPANPLIAAGDKLTIPGPDTQLPTATPLPDNLGRGTKIEYKVQLGDSLLSIANQFLSTVDAIKEENGVENENEIFVGQTLIIPVNLVTPVPTGTNTPTATPGAALPVFPSSTPAGPAAPAATTAVP